MGISFDTVEEQKAFAEKESFPYLLLSDADKSIGARYDTIRAEGEPYAEYGVPRRHTYLIAPDGTIAKAYDVQNDEFETHASQVLEDIRARS